MSIATLPQALPTGIPLPITSGRVVNILRDNSIIVDVEGVGKHCRRAASCLLMPEIGDLVLFIQPVDAQLWIIAVLEKADIENSTEIVIQGDLHISTQGGSLSLNSEEKLIMNSHSLEISSIKAEYDIDILTYQGDEVNAHVGINRWVGDRYEAIWHTETHFSEMSFRQVKQIEHLRVGQLDYQARDYLRLHSHNTLITADKITKIDSEQIHVG